MKKTYGALLATSLLMVGTQASAANFNIQNLQNLGQTQFQSLSDDLSAAVWMNPSNSAESRSAGLIPVGFQAGFEATSLSVNNNAWNAIGINAAALVVPKLRLSVGIPFGLDFGYMYTAIPSSNIQISGYEGRLNFGSFIPLPMVELNARAYQSKLSGVPELSVKDSGYAVMLGADFPIFKPYVEVGQVKSTATPSGAAATAGLKEYTKTSTTTAIGAKLSIFPLVILNGEYATVNNKSMYTFKIAAEF